MKRFATICLLAVMALAGSAALHAEEKATPKYKGKPLTYWIERLQKAEKDEEQRQAAEAIKAFGTDAVPAVPALIEMLDDRSFEFRQLALEILRSLGPKAKDALPVLVRKLKEPAQVGGQRTLVNEHQEVMDTLGSMGPDAKEAVPVLIEKLENRRARLWAASALASIGPSAKSAIPALRKMILQEQKLQKPASEPEFTRRGSNQPSSSEIAVMGISALGHLGSESIPTLKELVGMTALDINLKHKVVRAMGLVGPAGKDAVPLLKEFLKDERPVLRSAAVVALWRIQKNDEGLPAAREFLNDAIRRMGKGEKSEGDKFANPLSSARSQDPALEEILEFLGEIGPDAKDLLPELKKLYSASSQDPALRYQIEGTYERITQSDKPREKEQP
jgi:HEAT repeat protein